MPGVQCKISYLGAVHIPLTNYPSTNFLKVLKNEPQLHSQQHTLNESISSNISLFFPWWYAKQVHDKHMSLRFWPWTLYQFWTLKLHSGYSDHARCAALAFNLYPQDSRILHTFMVGVTPLCKKKFRVQTRSSDYLCFHSFWIPCKSISSDKRKYLWVLESFTYFKMQSTPKLLRRLWMISNPMF